MHTHHDDKPAERSSHVHTCCVTSVTVEWVHRASASTPLLDGGFLVSIRHESSSQVRCARSRHHFRRCPRRYNAPADSTSTFHDMAPHSLEARSTSTTASRDILRTPPVHRSLKPSHMFAQRMHSNQLLPSCRVQKLRSQVCSTRQRAVPVDFHLSVRPGESSDLKMLELPNTYGLGTASCC